MKATIDAELIELLYKLDYRRQIKLIPYVEKLLIEQGQEKRAQIISFEHRKSPEGGNPKPGE